MDDVDEGTATPAWWQDWPPLRWATEEERSLAKQRAAANLLGTAMNVPSDHPVYRKISAWTEPEDYPGTLHTIAEAVLWQDHWTADIYGLVMRMINAGYADRIRNGVLVVDLYWSASMFDWEYAALTLRTIRAQEHRLAEAVASIERLGA